MTAEEIRTYSPEDMREGTTNVLIFQMLREIAAQLAELNGVIKEGKFALEFINKGEK